MYLQLKELGEQLLQSNMNQAYLCFEQAEYLCQEPQMKMMLHGLCQMLMQTGQVTVQKTAIVIVSYNQQYLMEKCIESIRQYCNPKTYSVVVFDNASADGVADWLATQSDLMLLKNESNVGFPIGCNVGAQYALEGYDIYLLNNDTRMTENALFWLRMGLYSDERIGAAGGIANYAGNHQEIDISFQLPSQYQEWAKTNNVIMSDAYEKRVRLSGFSMLVKRKVWDEVGGMDSDFSPGYFEDDDLSVRIRESGFDLIVCKNSFIYHAGSQSFSKVNGINQLLESHYRMFVEKHGFYIMQLAELQLDMADIASRISESTLIIEIGSALGKSIYELEHLYPNHIICGIESNPIYQGIVSQMDEVFLDVSTFESVIQEIDEAYDVLLIVNESYAVLSDLDKVQDEAVQLEAFFANRGIEIKKMVV